MATITIVHPQITVTTTIPDNALTSAFNAKCVNWSATKENGSPNISKVAYFKQLFVKVRNIGYRLIFSNAWRCRRVRLHALKRP